MSVAAIDGPRRLSGFAVIVAATAVVAATALLHGQRIVFTSELIVFAVIAAAVISYVYSLSTQEEQIRDRSQKDIHSTNHSLHLVVFTNVEAPYRFLHQNLYQRTQLRIAKGFRQILHIQSLAVFVQH